jgi:hypothetical protein
MKEDNYDTHLAFPTVKSHVGTPCNATGNRTLVSRPRHVAAFHGFNSWCNYVFYSFSTVDMSNGSINCILQPLCTHRKENQWTLNSEPRKLEILNEFRAHRTKLLQAGGAEFCLKSSTSLPEVVEKRSFRAIQAQCFPL